MSSMRLVLTVLTLWSLAATAAECLPYRLKSWLSADEYVVRTMDGKLYATGHLKSDGTLLINMRTRLNDGTRMLGLRGADQYAKIVRHFGYRVKRIADIWHLEAADNLHQFNELMRQGLTAEQAALRTWSGHQAARFGFTAVTDIHIEGTPGHAIGARVIFIRP